jgi:uncharacterized cupredoxin-like copper-binding protein
VQTRIAYAAIVATLALIAAACGGSDDDTTNANDDVRTIEIEMRDNAFSPDAIAVPAGEEVRLVFHNTGRVDHDAFIGDQMAQDDHEAEMRDDRGMHHGGDRDAAVTVEPGDTVTLTHTFDAGDDVVIGCHQPGHYGAGMKLDVTTT